MHLFYRDHHLIQQKDIKVVRDAKVVKLSCIPEINEET